MEQLFRSDTLQALTAKDAAHLVDALGVEMVIDLRLAREAMEEGRGLLADASLHLLRQRADWRWRAPVVTYRAKAHWFRSIGAAWRRAPRCRA